MTDRAPIEVQGDTIGKTVPQGWHTRTQAARAIGRSYDTVKRLHKEGIYYPSGWMRRGELKVWLYNDDDLIALAAIVNSIRPGPKPREVANGR